jgi:hypothetical protein
MLRRHFVRHGHWHHRRRSDLARFPRVRKCRKTVTVCADGRSEFGLTTKSKIAKSNLSANLVSVMQAGAIVGALVANPLADRWGRKITIYVVASFAFVGGLLQALSYGHLSCFYIGRFVEGLGLGGATMVSNFSGSMFFHSHGHRLLLPTSPRTHPVAFEACS